MVQLQQKSRITKGTMKWNNTYLHTKKSSKNIQVNVIPHIKPHSIVSKNEAKTFPVYKN